MGETATAATSVVSFIGFHPTKSHLEDGNYYADKSLFSYCLHTSVILTCNVHINYVERGGGQFCMVSLSIAKNRLEKRITCVPMTGFGSNHLLHCPVNWCAYVNMVLSQFDRVCVIMSVGWS